MHALFTQAPVPDNLELCSATRLVLQYFTFQGGKYSRKRICPFILIFRFAERSGFDSWSLDRGGHWLRQHMQAAWLTPSLTAGQNVVMAAVRL